jgi:hypothetical protein
MGAKRTPIRTGRLPQRLRTLGGLSVARTFSFRAVLRYGGPIGAERKLQSLPPGQAFEVLARKPACLSIREMALRAEEVPLPGPVVYSAFKPFGVFISNGVDQLQHDPKHGQYFYEAAAPRLDKVWAGMGLPAVFEPAVHFSADPLRGFKFFGKKQLGQGWADVFFLRLPGYELLLHLSPQSFLPVRLSVFWRIRAKKPSLFFEVDFHDWRLDLLIPDEVFDPTPPPDAQPFRSRREAPP